MDKRQKIVVAAVLCAGLWALAGGVHAQADAAAQYPNKPVKFIVPFPSGSGTDASARNSGMAITALSGQAVVVENRPGASGFIAAQTAASAVPDGYTILVTTNTTHAANAALYKKLPYDPVKDFEPVALMGTSGLALVVHPDSPYRTAQDLIRFARENPDKLSFGSGSSSTRIAGEMFRLAADSRALHVPYKGVPQALMDLVGKQVDFMVADLNPSLPLIQQGKLRALAVTTATRYATLPDVPTLQESGLKNFEMVAWSAAFAPRGTPQPIVHKLHQLIRKGQQTESSKAFYKASGGQPASGSPADLAAWVQSETAKWAQIVKAAGIEPE